MPRILTTFQVKRSRTIFVKNSVFKTRLIYSVRSVYRTCIIHVASLSNVIKTRKDKTITLSHLFILVQTQTLICLKTDMNIPGQEKSNVWLVCDPDCVDAFALLIAAFSDKVNLLGISTVSGNQVIKNMTKNTLSFLYSIGFIAESV